MPRAEGQRVAPSAGKVRAFRSEDTDAVLAIAAESREAAGWSREGYRQLLQDTGTVALVIEDSSAQGPELAGFLISRTVASEAEVLNLAVAPDRRRRGYATLLLQAVEEEFRVRGVLNVHLEVRQSNAAAIAFYQRHGFEPVGLRKAYYRDPNEAALTMSKTLESSRH